jgi:hypothetical protein
MFHNEGVALLVCQISIEPWWQCDEFGRMLVRKYAACCCVPDFEIPVSILASKEDLYLCCCPAVPGGSLGARMQIYSLTTAMSLGLLKPRVTLDQIRYQICKMPYVVVPEELLPEMICSMVLQETSPDMVWQMGLRHLSFLENLQSEERTGAAQFLSLPPRDLGADLGWRCERA